MVGNVVGADEGIVVDGAYVCPGKVGSMVGYWEGSWLGRFDGCKLGCFEGERVVGFFVGERVGIVGEEEGFDVDGAVGATVNGEFDTGSSVGYEHTK